MPPIIVIDITVTIHHQEVILVTIRPLSHVCVELLYPQSTDGTKHELHSREELLERIQTAVSISRSLAIHNNANHRRKRYVPRLSGVLIE
jgi:hypothetical protein